MGVGLYLTGRCLSERPERWLPAAQSCFAQLAADMLLESHPISDSEGNPGVGVSLHPCAEDLELILPEPGLIIASAKTSTVGPGYHIYICELLRQFGTEMRIQWDAPDEDAGTGDGTGFFHTGDPSAVEDETCRWLSSIASFVIENSEQDYAGFMISMPVGHQYPHEDGVVTPLGPRDPAWFKRAAADPASCTNFFPWWRPERDAQFYLGRALCRMWRDVRWRPPLFDDERDLLLSIVRDLERAWNVDPNGGYPWREWHELLCFLAAYDHGQSARRYDDLGAEIARRAADSHGERLIGYRRRPVRANLSGGWSLEIPGEMAETWNDGGQTWSAWDALRTVWFNSYSIRNKDRALPGAEELLQSATSDRLNGGVIHHRDGDLIGMASIEPHEEDGETMWCLRGYSAVPGEVGVCSIFFADLDERDWATDTWKSLKRPATDDGY